MEWVITLLNNTDSAAQSVLALSMVGVVGLLIGRLKIRGISIGIAGMLFAGLAFGHFGLKLNPFVLRFARDFGLILFVYTIGLQVGPGFFSSLKRHGLALNLMAGSIVLLGAACTVALVWFFGVDVPVGVGIFSGATTNTPSLAAAQEALANATTDGADLVKLTTLGYAMAYPGAIVGIIVTMMLLRLVFKTPDKTTALDATGGLAALDLRVTNAALDGIAIKGIPEMETGRLVISRIMHEGAIHVAHPDSIVRLGDVIHAVGPADDLARLRLVVGSLADIDLVKAPSALDARWVLVTREHFAGKTIKQLGLFHIATLGDLTITRIRRSELEFTANDDTRVQLGDELRVVGDREALARCALTLGNSTKQLNHPHLIPIFAGLTLGVLLGSLPILVPGVPTPIKLGIAGGPLLVAILFGFLSNKGFRFGYMSQGANLMLRELGIVLFLATVGIHSGDEFIDTLIHGGGLKWAAYGMFVTVVPLLIVGTIAARIRKVSTPVMFGLLSGSMTDPPALAFANTMMGNDSPSVSYATVYPLVMMMRIVMGQLLATLLIG